MISKRMVLEKSKIGSQNYGCCYVGPIESDVGHDVLQNTVSCDFLTRQIGKLASVIARPAVW